MIFESPYTKMVSRSGEAKYYTGSPSQFKATAWNSYASAGRNYLVKFV
jgi:hypothetical protein